MHRVSLLSIASLFCTSILGTAQVTTPAVVHEAAVRDAASTIETQRKPGPASMRPLTHFALGGGISLMGINLQTATNVNRYLNLRFAGNFFNYSINDVSTNGFKGSGKLNFATAGASVDFYPFPNRGFRLSPGLLFYNENTVDANVNVASGQSFDLNHVTYYSSTTSPVHGSVNLRLNEIKPAFTMTTGWGNMISRRNHRWSFPFEIGAAFVGSPKLKARLNGQACSEPGLPSSCFDAATNPGLQANLAAQLAKNEKDLDPLKVFPILSFGISYNFHTQE